MVGGGHGERDESLGPSRGPQGREDMKRHRIIAPTTVLPATLLALALMPVSAQAGSLLSGYGGPGAGNQAILGSTLLNGPRGGGGGSSAGGSNSKLSGLSSTGTIDTGARAGRSGGEEPVRPSAADRRPTRGGHGEQAKGGASRSAGGETPSRAFSAYPASERAETRATSSAALGLSGADLLYVLLAFGVLVLTGVLTRRLTRVTVAGTDS
jgi:hypothetical protein